MKKLNLLFLIAALCASAPNWAAENPEGFTLDDVLLAQFELEQRGGFMPGNIIRRAAVHELELEKTVPSWAAESGQAAFSVEAATEKLDEEIKQGKPQPPMCLADGSLDEDKGERSYFWWGNHLENIGHRLKEQAFCKAKPSLPTFDKQPEFQQAYRYYQAAVYAYEMSAWEGWPPGNIASVRYTRDAIKRCSEMTESDT